MEAAVLPTAVGPVRIISGFFSSFSTLFSLYDSLKFLFKIMLCHGNDRRSSMRAVIWIIQGQQFRRERDVIWIDKSIVGRDEDKLITFMLDQLRKKEIIR